MKSKIPVINKELIVNSEEEKILECCRIFDRSISETDAKILLYLIGKENESYMLKDEKDPKSAIKIIKLNMEEIIKKFSLKSVSSVYTSINKLKKIGMLEEIEGKKNTFVKGENLKRILNKNQVVIQTKIALEK